jgi:hypothetical protein
VSLELGAQKKKHGTDLVVSYKLVKGLRETTQEGINSTDLFQWVVIPT